MAYINGEELFGNGCPLTVYRGGSGPNVYAVGGLLTADRQYPDRLEALVEVLRASGVLPVAWLNTKDAGLTIKAPRFVWLLRGRFYRSADLVMQAFCYGIAKYSGAPAASDAITYLRRGRELFLDLTPASREDVAFCEDLADLFSVLPGVQVKEMPGGSGIVVRLPRAWRSDRTSVGGLAAVMAAACRTGAGIL